MTATRDRIIVASNELFRRYGYNGTSLSQISAASGATTGSIYHFFPGGKEDLGVAVIETTAGVYRELFESIAGATSDPSQEWAFGRSWPLPRRRRSRPPWHSCSGLPWEWNGMWMPTTTSVPTLV